jgi:hypothetical protein
MLAAFLSLGIDSSHIFQHHRVWLIPHRSTAAAEEELDAVTALDKEKAAIRARMQAEQTGLDSGCQVCVSIFVGSMPSPLYQHLHTHALTRPRLLACACGCLLVVPVPPRSVGCSKRVPTVDRRGVHLASAPLLALLAQTTLLLVRVAVRKGKAK